MANFGQACLYVGLGLQHDISAARAPTEEPTGQWYLKLFSADVLALKLGILLSSATSTLLPYPPLGLRTISDQVMIPSVICKLFQGAARSGQVFYSRHLFFWKAILAGWSRPFLQHDVAEFLKFPLFNFLNGHWQARELDDSICRITVPLALEFNSNEAEYPCLI